MIVHPPQALQTLFRPLSVGDVSLDERSHQEGWGDELFTGGLEPAPKRPPSAVRLSLPARFMSARFEEPRATTLIVVGIASSPWLLGVRLCRNGDSCRQLFGETGSRKMKRGGSGQPELMSGLEGTRRA